MCCLLSSCDWSGFVVVVEDSGSRCDATGLNRLHQSLSVLCQPKSRSLWSSLVLLQPDDIVNPNPVIGAKIQPRNLGGGSGLLLLLGLGGLSGGSDGRSRGGSGRGRGLSSSGGGGRGGGCGSLLRLRGLRDGRGSRGSSRSGRGGGLRGLGGLGGYSRGCGRSGSCTKRIG